MELAVTCPECGSLVTGDTRGELEDEYDRHGRLHEDIPAPWTADAILKILREHAEDETKPGWRLVYLDNARPNDVSPHAFAGFLSALQARAVYEPYDNFAWGIVKTEGA